MKKLFIDEFERSWDLINSDTPFCHARYADGEICLMKGRPISQGSQATDVDRWTSPDKMTLLGRDLLESLKMECPNYFYAISCDTSSKEDKDWLLSRINQDRKYITFANLWINGNYNRFLEKLQTLKKPVVIIANQSGENKRFPFEVSEYMSFGNDCVNLWESYSSEIKSILQSSFINHKEKTFFISVGPLSEVIIHFLWKINPHNQYIDVGSALDEFIHGRKTRPYMISETFYNKQMCEMTV